MEEMKFQTPLEVGICSVLVMFGGTSKPGAAPQGGGQGEFPSEGTIVPLVSSLTK